MVIGIDAGPGGAVVATGIAGATGPAFVDPPPPPQPATAIVERSAARSRVLIIISITGP
jgi:hypothetical protein